MSLMLQYFAAWSLELFIFGQLSWEMRFENVIRVPAPKVSSSHHLANLFTSDSCRMTMARMVLILAGLIAGSLAHYESPLVTPLALVGDRPLSVANTISEVPMLLVPRNELALYSRVHISSVSDTQPLVTCQLNRHTLDAVPAVRVVLRQPMIIDSPESYLPFPSQINVVHEGLRMSVPVGALIVPIPSHDFQGPTLVRVMYAVPAGPLQLQYPVYSNSPVPYPLRPEYGTTGTRAPQPTLAPQPQPYPTLPLQPRPVAPFRPVYTDLNNVYSQRRPSRPLVTVLNFPSEIASPETLFYQPPIDESGELGNRNPPEAVIPAGIVQSTQPRPTLQVFLNSKEHPLLQSLRDEAENNRDKVTANSITVGVEAL
ncbi:Hypothetical protein NTJ_06023 [Nesidiocoris tenuis]|uniref:Uncharacterized protein n=1 Tax=Nesidiocoris tenuis TaxID=355587 RepID=A0ABN7AP64_9HEMI|nr:Hypothetical protein NTJ_06023 [Nesidiocoris tenuis]